MCNTSISRVGMNFNRETVQNEDALFDLIELLFRQLTYTGRTKLISTDRCHFWIDQMSKQSDEIQANLFVLFSVLKCHVRKRV